MTYQQIDYPEKSWSNSRKNVFQECKRKYYYEYYMSHNGWEEGSEELSKQAYMYKKLEGIYTKVGNLLHHEFATTIENMKDDECELQKTPNDIRTAVLIKARELVRNSRKEEVKEKFRRRPSKQPMLQEYFIGNGISDEEGILIENKIEECADGFFGCTTYDVLGACPELMVVENDTEAYNTFLIINGVKAYFKVDLLYKQPKEGKYYIIDWKTGNFSDKDKEQLLLYAYYVYKKYNIEPSNIVVRIEYVRGSNNYQSDLFTKEDMKIAEQIITNSMDEMNSYLEDISINKPKQISEFPMINECGNCKLCKYRVLCQRN